MLEPTGREAAPIRKVFVQVEEGEGGGPLAELVTNHDERALDLYLLLHAKASGGDFDVTLGAPVWGRALGLAPTRNGRTAVSKAWKRLEDLGLIGRGRVGRTARVVLLKEDGKGADYTRPMSTEDGYWFNLSHRYWLDGWYLKLDLPAKTMLLVALSLYNGFYLPFEHAKRWYSISRKTAQAGMKTLVDNGIVDRVEDWVEEPLSDIGHRLKVNYTLRPPFGPHPVRDTAKKSAAAKRSTRRAVKKSAGVVQHSSVVNKASARKATTTEQAATAKAPDRPSAKRVAAKRTPPKVTGGRKRKR